MPDATHRETNRSALLLIPLALFGYAACVLAHADETAPFDAALADGGSPVDGLLPPAAAVGGGGAVPPAVPAVDGGAASVGEDRREKAEQPSDDAITLSEIHIEGELLEPGDKLARFLGLIPGVRWNDTLKLSLDPDVGRLGYELDGVPQLSGTKLTIKLRVLKVVRTVRVTGNFPLFDDEIIRHLSFTSGTQLPPDQELDTYFTDESKRVSDYLGREGYFGNKVHIEQRPRPADHAVDLIVRVNLGGWARPFTLGAIQPTGNHAITDHALFDLFSHGRSIWGRFSLQRMRDDARAAEQAYKKLGYPAARVVPEFDEHKDTDWARRRVTLPVKVSEKRRVDIKFVGNRQLSDKELRDQLTIFTTGAYDEIELATSARKVERYYQQRGYFEARVSFRRRRVDQGPPKEADDKAVEPAPRNDVEEITFLIDEGPELRVRDVQVEGEGGAPLAFISEELQSRAALETKVFPRLGAIGLGSGGYLTAVQLAQDVERLVDFYKAQGYPKAKVRSEVARDPFAFGGIGALGAASAGADTSATELFVRFYVNEGPHEVCDGVDIDFSGAHIKSAKDLMRALKVKAGSPFTEEAVADDARRIIAAYRKLGRPYVQADYSGSTWNADHTRIRVRYHVTEGPEVRFGEILIRGNFKTHARVIRLDLPFHTGDLFDLDKLEEGERNLQTHFIFDSVRATPVGLDAHRNPVPILITVRERYLDWGGFVAAVGVSSDRLPYYWYVSLAYQWNNVLGFGSQLEVKGDFDWINSWGVIGRYTDLHAFGPKWRFDMTGFYRKELTNRLGEITTYGASLSLSRYITRALRAYVRYDNYLSETGVGVLRLPSTNERASVSDDTHTAKIGVGLVWDRRVGADGNPNPLAPVKGWLLQAQVGWAFPSSVRGNAFVDFFSSDNNFLVLAGQAMFIQPFKLRSSTFTFLANLRYDQGIPFGSPALPAVERYFAGGDTTTRGYETDELKTEVVRSPISPLPGEAGFRIIAEGGNIRMLSTLEIQFPIAKSFIGLPIQWVGALFYDVGTVFDSWNTVARSDVKQSIGGTFLRLLTPFGPLSLEYAYPINPGLAEERWKSNPWYTHWPGRIHFNWGIPLARF